MPMYKPTKLDVGCGGQVLDLETAVKDGILGGGCGGGGMVKAAKGGAMVEKHDLSKMIEELGMIEVPTVFICPISFEPMQDPVTLCTGQTYERPNILKWLSMGHFTCPTTMQELWDDSITPNRTLYHLMHSWYSAKYLAMKKRSEDVGGRVLEILESLKQVKGQSRVHALKELRQIVVSHSSARETMVEKGGITLMSSLLGPFTSHSIGSEVVGILVNLSFDGDSRMGLMEPARISLMVDMLNEGSIETKINCARLIKNLMEGDGFESRVVSSLSLLVGLLRLVKDKRHPNGVQPGLALLKAISSLDSVRCSILTVGAIPQLVELLSILNPECLELALSVIKNLCSLPKGVLALKNCPKTIPNVVKLLMRVSEECNQLALSILGALCELAPEDCAKIAVDAGLAAKLLLVIQSGCNPTLKQQSAELLKLCSLNYTAALLISECTLTRTLQ
ncbi:hypothetical protein Droror1_Dr00013642 [Drosera rotundifolia]